MFDIESVYREYFPKVYNYVYYKLLDRDRSDDLVSEIFLRIFEKRDSYDVEKGTLSAWIFRVAHNAVVDDFRRRKEVFSLGGGEMDLPDDCDIQLAVIQSEERKELYRLLAGMTARERAILSMKYFADMTNRDIAAALDMNESTVSSAVWNAMRKLREGMRAYVGESRYE